MLRCSKEVVVRPTTIHARKAYTSGINARQDVDRTRTNNMRAGALEETGDAGSSRIREHLPATHAGARA